jgi:hypothetical protein
MKIKLKSVNCKDVLTTVWETPGFNEFLLIFHDITLAKKSRDAMENHHQMTYEQNRAF